MFRIVKTIRPKFGVYHMDELKYEQMEIFLTITKADRKVRQFLV